MPDQEPGRAGNEGLENRGLVVKIWDRRREIRHRFGLDGGDPQNLTEAARALGCSLPTARKMEREALARREQLLGPRPRRPQAGKGGE